MSTTRKGTICETCIQAFLGGYVVPLRHVHAGVEAKLLAALSGTSPGAFASPRDLAKAIGVDAIIVHATLRQMREKKRVCQTTFGGYYLPE
jgi:hypothetical protein